MVPRKDEVNGKQEDGGGVEPRDGAEQMDDAQVSTQLSVLPLTTQEPGQPPCPAPSVKTVRKSTLPSRAESQDN